MGRTSRSGSRKRVQNPDGRVRREERVVVLLAVDQLELEIFQVLLQLVDCFFFLGEDKLQEICSLFF